MNQTNQRLIVALTGKKGAGKSTFAQALISHNPLFEASRRISFAAGLKKMLAVILPQEAFLPENKERVELGLCGRTPRYLMQTLGSEWGRQMISPSIWTSLTQREILSEGPERACIIDDARFDNEVLALKEIPNSKVVVIEVTRNDRPTSTPSDAHCSEAGLSRDLIDLVINNAELADLEAFCQKWTP